MSGLDFPHPTGTRSSRAHHDQENATRVIGPLRADVERGGAHPPTRSNRRTPHRGPLHAFAQTTTTAVAPQLCEQTSDSTTRNGEDAYTLCPKHGAHHWTAGGPTWLTRRLLAAGLDVGRRDAWGNDALMLSVCATLRR